MASTKKLQVEIVGDSKDLERAFGKAGRSAGDFDKKASKTRRTLGLLGKAAGAGALALGAGLAAGVAIGVKGLIEDEKAIAKVESAIKSTGGVAGVSSKDVQKLAGSLQSMSGVGADTIMTNQSLLLSFTNIRNEAGKGNDVFDQATKTMLDMSVALDQDMKSSAIQVGKALNDPIKGITALSRVGVSFTQAQKDQIAAMVESGNTMGAQKVILAELNKEFGGTAKALGQTTAGRIERVKRQFEEMAKRLTAAVLPAISALSNWLMNVGMPAMEQFANVVQDTVARWGPPIREAFEGLRDEAVSAWESIDGLVIPAVSGLRDVAVKLGEALATTVEWFSRNRGALDALVSIVGAALAAYITYSTILKVQAAWTAVVTAATNGQTIAQRLLNAAMTANPIGLIITGLVALAAGLVIAYKRSETFRNIVNGAFDVVKTAFAALVDAGKAVVGFFRETLPGAAEATLDWLRSNWPIIATIISGPFAPLVALATDAFGIRSALTGAMGKLRDKVKEIAGDAWDGIKSALTKPLGWWEWIKGETIDKVPRGFLREWAGDAWSAMKDALTKPLDFVSFLSRQIGDAIDAFKVAGDGAKARASALGSAIVGAIKDAVTAAAKGPVNAFRVAVNKLIGAVNKALPINIPKIPEFARGVIANKPTLGVFGEAGPEALIPLGRDKRSSALPLLETAAAAHGMELVLPKFGLGGLFKAGAGAVKDAVAQTVPGGAAARVLADALGLSPAELAKRAIPPLPAFDPLEINGRDLMRPMGEGVWDAMADFVKRVGPRIIRKLIPAGSGGATGATGGVWEGLLRAFAVANRVLGGGFTITSGRRNSTVAGTNRGSRHNTGDAIDISKAGWPSSLDPMASLFARWFGLPSTVGWNSAGGANMGFRTNRFGNHFNHIHLASTDRGVFSASLARAFPGLGSFATGTPYVPETGPAMLHRGEAVLAPDEARNYRARMAGGDGAALVNIEHATFTNPTDVPVVMADLTNRIVTRMAVA